MGHRAQQVAQHGLQVVLCRFVQTGQKPSAPKSDVVL